MTQPTFLDLMNSTFNAARGAGASVRVARQVYPNLTAAAPEPFRLNMNLFITLPLDEYTEQMVTAESETEREQHMAGLMVSISMNETEDLKLISYKLETQGYWRGVSVLTGFARIIVPVRLELTNEPPTGLKALTDLFDSRATLEGYPEPLEAVLMPAYFTL